MPFFAALVLSPRGLGTGLLSNMQIEEYLPLLHNFYIQRFLIRS